MATITCPKCGTENPADAMNCKNCKVNLKYALEHSGEMEFAREHPDMFGPGKQEAAQGIPRKVVSRKQARKKKGLTWLAIAVVCFVINLMIPDPAAVARTKEEALSLGIAGAIFASGFLICFVVGVIYLIAGFVGKETSAPPVESTEKKRGGCLTAYLILMLIANPLIGLYYLLAGSTVRQSHPTLPEWAIPVLGLLSFANFAFAIGVWKWKRWGVYGFVGSALVAFLFNVMSGEILVVLGGLVGVVILAFVLAFLIRPVWHQMD